jgi:hypothetical protein
MSGDSNRLWAKSIRERVAVLVDDPGDLADFLTGTILLSAADHLTIDQARALGWLEGAAEALDMTVVEFVDANT